LTSDGEGPREIAALMTRQGFGASRIHVMEALGGAREKVSAFQAEDIGEHAFDPLNVVAVEVAATGEARILPLGTGLADDLFAHDGQITKREIRAVTLSALAPRRGEMLWD